MANESANTLYQARKILTRFDKQDGIKRVSLTNEEFKIVKNLLRWEYENIKADYEKSNSPHHLAILQVVENARRKFIDKE